MSPRFPCVTQVVNLRLRYYASKVVYFTVCGGFVDDQANGGWFLSYWD